MDQEHGKKKMSVYMCSSAGAGGEEVTVRS